MLDLRQIEHDILAKGRVDGPELEVLCRQVYAGGTIDRRGADFLVELHKRVQHLTPAFEQFFYQAIKDHIGLTNLETLNLQNTTGVADLGLMHLNGLTKLRKLTLDGTKVTDAGIQDLQQALPKAKISH
jgi:hypothetical protein